MKSLWTAALKDPMFYLALAHTTVATFRPKTTITNGRQALLEQNSSKLLKFTGDEAVNHFSKHASNIMKAKGVSKYNLKNYMEDANWIVKHGTYNPKLNGYYHYMGNSRKSGEALYGFVGLKNQGAAISTFHIKSASELGLK